MVPPEFRITKLFRAHHDVTVAPVGFYSQTLSSRGSKATIKILSRKLPPTVFSLCVEENDPPCHSRNLYQIPCILSSKFTFVNTFPLIELTVIKLLIKALLPQQLAVRALLNDIALVHNEDNVALADGR